MSSNSQNTFLTHQLIRYLFFKCYGLFLPYHSESPRCRLNRNFVVWDSLKFLRNTCTFSPFSGGGSCTARLLLYQRRWPLTWRFGPFSSSAYWKNVHDVAQGTNGIVYFNLKTSDRIFCLSWGPLLFSSYGILLSLSYWCHLVWIKFLRRLAWSI